MAQNDTQSSERASPRDLGSQMATIIFDGHSRLIHQSRLRPSRVLTHALNSSFKEGLSSQIEVSGRKEIVFLVLDWLYSKKLPTHDELDKIDFEPLIEAMPKPLCEYSVCAWLMAAIECYIFADLYDIPDLRWQLLHFIYKSNSDQALAPSEVWMITENLPSTSKLYVLAVDIFVCGNSLGRRLDKEGFEELGWHVIGAEFWQAVTRLLLPTGWKQGALPDVGKYIED